MLLEELFDKLNYSAFIEAFIPTTRAIVILPWDGRTMQIRKEGFVPSRLGKDVVKRMFIIAPDMLADLILGANFLNDTKLR